MTKSSIRNICKKGEGAREVTKKELGTKLLTRYSQPVFVTLPLLVMNCIAGYVPSPLIRRIQSLIHVLTLDSSVALGSNGVVGLPGFGVALTLVNK
jgi:hypothetical protein